MTEKSLEDLHHKGVALVDDDAAVLDSTALLLELHDVPVRSYANGGDFLNDNPDVACLVIDYHMPGLNGLEVDSRAMKSGFDAPAVMITATIDPSVERLAAMLGLAQVLKKPLNEVSLLDALQIAVAEQA